MSRLFTAASSEYVSGPIGACNFAFGPGTIAAVVRRASNAANHCIIRCGTTSSARYDFLIASTDLLRCFVNNSGVSAATLKLLAADEWCLVAMNKATGTVAPRFYKYVYATGGSTFENSGSTIANSGAAGTTAWLGTQQNTAGWWNGDIAIAAVWNVVLSDDQILNLRFDRNAWFQQQPKGLWILDQAAVTQLVTDQTGNGSTETARNGTAVSTGTAPFSYAA